MFHNAVPRDDRDGGAPSRVSGMEVTAAARGAEDARDALVDGDLEGLLNLAKLSLKVDVYNAVKNGWSVEGMMRSSG